MKVSPNLIIVQLYNSFRMTQESGSNGGDSFNRRPLGNQQDENEDAENLFNQVDLSNEEASKNQRKKLKKLKKAKKQKKSKKQKKNKKKKKRQQEDEQQYGFDDEEDDQSERNSYFDEEAESDDQQENYQQDQEDNQIGDEQERERFNTMINKKSAGAKFMENLAGKNDKDIDRMYSRGANMIRQNQAMYPGQQDPKVYVVTVNPRHEDEIVLYLLNKAMHLAKTSGKMSIISATSIKKKYSGKIFVQAMCQKDVRDALEGFNNVNLGRVINQLDREGYIELFNEKSKTNIEFEESNYVRINKGLYEGDLAQIYKIRNNNSVDVLVVPRLNIQEISMRIRERASKISNQEERKQKMGQLLSIFLQYKSNNFRKRPQKKTLSDEELRQHFGDMTYMKKIKLSTIPPGLLILNYKFDEISKNQGTYRPVQIMPFTSSDCNFIDKVNQFKGKLTTQTNYKKGEEVQVIDGAMIGHFGIISQIIGNIAIIRCKNRQFKNQKFQENVENIAKKFNKGQRVKVITGDDVGKTGIVLKIEQKHVQILTDNQNSIRINKKNLEVSKAENICEQNVHKLKKDDLIKTSKNHTGIVIQTSKDNIKILDTNNTIQIVSNMDYDSKVNTRNIVAKNRSGDQITSGCLVIIREGPHKDKKCKVIHVYRQNVFLFNADFIRTAGISVQNAENLGLISKSQVPNQGRSFSAKSNMANIGTNDNKDQITINKTITLRSGPLKGYQGVVKSINKDKIQVRVLSKATTVWVPRQNVTAKQETFEIGKTPNRKGGNTHSYVPSPSRY